MEDNHRELFSGREGHRMRQADNGSGTDKPAIYIYQMGKVGSLSVVKTLENTGLNVHHEHCLTRTHPEAVGIRRISGRCACMASRLKTIRNRFYPGARMRSFRKERRVKIITLVREAISRNLSLCFHHFQDFIRDDVTARTFDGRMPAFDMFSYYLENRVDHRAGVRWFDREFFPTTGVDVYRHPFDREKGVAVIHEGKFDILVLQLEKLNLNMGAVRCFLGLEAPLDPVRTNMGSEKWYQPLYQAFKERYVPSPEQVDDIYNSRFMTHFYNEADRLRFRQRWGTSPTA